MDAVRFVPLEKRSKKEQRRHYAAQRADWNGVIPVTKVIPDKKKQQTGSRKNAHDWDRDE